MSIATLPKKPRFLATIPTNKEKKMKIEINLPEEGFVIIPLEEYLKLKKIEEESKQLWQEKIQHILKYGGVE